MAAVFRAASAALAIYVAGTVIAYAQQPAPAKAETVRPELGKPLQAAQELMKAQKPKQALAEIAKADEVANKTAYESYVIERMRASAAVAAGDAPASIKSVEAIIASGRLPPAEQLPMVGARSISSAA